MDPLGGPLAEAGRHPGSQRVVLLTGETDPTLPLLVLSPTLHCCLTDAGLLTPGGFYNEYSELVDSGDYRMAHWYTDIVHQKNLARVSDKMVADFK